MSSWWTKKEFAEDRDKFKAQVETRTGELSPQHGSSRVMGPVAGGRGYVAKAREMRQQEREQARKGREGRKVKQ